MSSLMMFAVLLLAQDATSISEEPQESFVTVSALLSDSEEQVRLRGIDKLQKSDSRSPEDAAKLRELITSDESDGVREAALKCFVKIVDIDVDTGSILRETLQNDPSDSVRLAAAELLVLNGDRDPNTSTLVNSFMREMAEGASFQTTILALCWWLGAAVVIGLLFFAIVLGCQYLFLKDLRRSLMITALAYAFLPHSVLEILARVVEHRLFDIADGSWVLSIAGTILAAGVIIVAMFLIDGQDRRRTENTSNDANPKAPNRALASALTKFCGHPIEDHQILAVLMREIRVPESLEGIQNIHEGFYTAIHRILFEVEMTEEIAKRCITESVHPGVLMPNQAFQLVAFARRRLTGIFIGRTSQ